jgi:hypothetical protein
MSDSTKRRTPTERAQADLDKAQAELDDMIAKRHRALERMQAYDAPIAELEALRDYFASHPLLAGLVDPGPERTAEGNDTGPDVEPWEYSEPEGPKPKAGQS